MKYDKKKHYNLKLEYTNKGLSGLVNLGNSCFMNSIIQCLSNTLGLTEYFLKDTFRKEDPEGHYQKRPEYNLVLCYTHLLKNMWETNEVLKPRSFRESVGKLEGKYASGSQQDSHEFLVHLLDFLHKGIAYEIEVGIKGEIIRDSDRLMIECIKEWQRHFEKSYSIIIDSFYGMFSNKITCSNCHKDSRQFEPFSAISLPIGQNSDNLEMCLKNYFEMSLVDGYTCEFCKKGHNSEKKVSFWMLPNYLIMTFKRFNNKNQKISTKIDFSVDTDLDLTPFISTEKEDRNSYIYSLYAINCHTGDTRGGHYYSYIKNINGDIYMMNDANVMRIPDEKLICYEDAYILFFYRKFVN
jgi:ubiquitin C-terminal hydrolase